MRLSLYHHLLAANASLLLAVGYQSLFLPAVVQSKKQDGWLPRVTVTSIAKTTAVQQSKNISYYRQRENALKNPLNILNYYYFTIKYVYFLKIY